MKRAFTKLLKELDEEDLRQELQNIYDRFPQVREYYKLELGENTKGVLERYRKALRKAFFTGRRRMNRRGRSASTKVLKEFAAISIHPRDLVDLTFYRVEVMIEAIGHYYVENEAFYNSLGKSYAQACQLARKEMLEGSFKDKAFELAEYFDREKVLHYVSLWEVFDIYFGGE